MEVKNRRAVFDTPYSPFDENAHKLNSNYKAIISLLIRF